MINIAMLSYHTCPLAILGGKNTGGMNVYVRELTRFLGQEGVHADVFTRMGYGDEVEEIQDLFLAGRKDEAIKRVPLSLVEDVAMVGPIDKVREELEHKWRKTCMTTLLVNGNPDHLRLVADLVNG